MPICRSPEALWVRNIQKVSKRSSRASGPGVSKKVRAKRKKKSQRTRERVKKVSKISVRRLFRRLFCSGKKKEPKPKVFGPDIFRWGGGVFHVNDWEAKKVRYVPRNTGKPNFWAGYAGISRERPKNLRKKVCVQFSSPICDLFETFLGFQAQRASRLVYMGIAIAIAAIFLRSAIAMPIVGFGKRGLLEKGSFQKSPFSRDSRELRDLRDSRERQDSGKQRRIRPFSRDSREFRDLRESSSEKTPFVMTPFSGPDIADPRNRSRLLRQDLRHSNAALRFKVAMEGRWRFAISSCDF